MKMRVSLYPNNELRVVMSKERGFRNFWEDAIADSEVADIMGTGCDSPPLDITSELSVIDGRPGYGGLPTKTVFGNNARRTISRSAGAMDKGGIPKEECVFLTGTIPGGTETSFESVARWSSWIVKIVKTWLSDRGVESPLSIYVWEFQKRGALHLHYMAHIPGDLIRAKVLEGWKSFWSGVIDGVGERSGVDMWERRNGGSWKQNKGVIQADAQIVKKGIGNYLSKYLSKNAPTGCASSPSGVERYGPVRWWGVSRPLLKMARDLTEEFELENIPHSKTSRCRQVVSELVRLYARRCWHYTDKASTCDVFIAFGESCVYHIYAKLWREFRYGTPL